MKVLYFKTDMYGDTYVSEGNFCKIVSITKDKIKFWADDENCLEGAYKVLKISEKNYEKLQEAAREGDRKKGLTLINKLHETNKKALSNPLIPVKIESFRKKDYPDLPFKMVESFQNKQPILN